MIFLNNSIAKSSRMMNPLSQFTDSGNGNDNDNDNSHNSDNDSDKDTKNPDCSHHT